MKNIFKVLGIIAIITVIGVSMISCEEDDNPFIGTWAGDGLTVKCTDSTWSAVGNGGSWSGTYTPKGNSADFIETNGSNFGTATVSGKTMTVASTYGSFRLTKQ